MAKTDNTSACGHEYTYQLYGKQADRDHKAKWLATQVCPDCRNGKVTKGSHRTEPEGTPIGAPVARSGWVNNDRDPEGCPLHGAVCRPEFHGR